ncbi:MAG: rod shape-determining protein MreD [Candidatus Aminicenantes bacterium]|nr:rod shape-determining protein MreD [Candidatus Aminicenantes bacterium]MDH5743115.1 rod shape-determining protein MreD [Candidatus Aminicenantes bacterium]
MKDFFWMALSVVAAFLLYTVLSKISLSLLHLINLFSLVVIYFASERGEICGACLGTFCGLIQDSFSLGVFGVAGVSKTLMGFLAGYFAGKVNVTPLKRSFLFIFVLISMELFIWASLFTFIFSERVSTGGGLLFFQPLLTALLGSAGLYFIRKKKKSSS